MSDAVLQVENLWKYFGHRRGRTPETATVKGVSLEIARGETLGLIGESGTGKTTVGRIISGLLRPDAGRIVFGGERIDDRRVRRGSARKIQMVFQDPYGSIDPRMRIGDWIGEAVRIHGDLSKRACRGAVLDLMERVNLDSYLAECVPAELSGGQLQRVSIARALACGPELLVCDEPVTALDVSVRAHILNLLFDVQAESQISMLFISHDIGVIRASADRVAVMSGGAIVETGPTELVWSAPQDDYTRQLIAAIPGGKYRNLTNVASATMTNGVVHA